MFATSSITGNLLSGAIPAVGIVIGGSVVSLVRRNREARKSQGVATTTEIKHLEATVQEMNEFMVGSPATAFRAAVPGFIERFDALEKKVDEHGVQLGGMDKKLDKILQNGSGH